MSAENDANRKLAIRFIDTIVMGKVDNFDQIVAPDARFFILGRGWIEHDPYLFIIRDGKAMRSQRLAIVFDEIKRRRASLLDRQCAQHEISDVAPRRAFAHQLPVVPDAFAVSV